MGTGFKAAESAADRTAVLIWKRPRILLQERVDRTVKDSDSPGIVKVGRPPFFIRKKNVYLYDKNTKL